MSSVSSSSENYQNYNKAIQKLEDEYELDRKRAREKEEKRVDSIHDKYEKTIRENEEDNEKALTEVRENMQESSDKTKDYYKSELERQKAQTYDKWGRFGGMEADEANRQVKRYEEEFEKREKDFKEREKKQEEVTAKRIQSLGDELSHRNEEAIRRQKESIGENVSTVVQADKEATRIYRDELARRYASLEEDNLAKQDLLRRNTEEAVKTMGAEREHIIQQTDDANSARLQKQNQASQMDLEKKTRELNRSAALEAAHLQRELDRTQSYFTSYGKGKAEGKADAVREYDSDVRAEIWSMKDRYTNELENLKQHSAESDQHYNQLNSKNLMEKDREFAKTLQKQNLEHHKREQDAQTSYIKELNQAKILRNKERDHHSYLVDKQAEDLSRQKQDALQNQAKIFQDDYERTRDQQMNQIRVLEKEIARQKSSDDPLDIPPAAENALMRNVLSKHEKMLKADDQRTREALDSMQKEYSRRMNEAVVDAQYRNTATQHENASKTHAERMEFLQHVHDVEQSKTRALSDQSSHFNKQIEKNTRYFGNTLEDQRKQYENIMKFSKLDSSDKLRAQQLDHEFKYKMTLREMSAKHNDTIRQYEKQIAFLKEDQELQLKDVKKQADEKIREAEKQAKREVEDQSRMYEQRIAQMEVQQKERERFLTESYEDKVERIQRSNALRTKKS